MHVQHERYPVMMDKQSQLLILLSGMLGLTLAILTSRPKAVTDAIIAVIGGLFGALILAPAFAEALTRFATTFPTFSWLDASPGTALFAAIIGLSGLLGGQIVIAVKSDFITWIKSYARKKLRIQDVDSSEG